MMPSVAACVVALSLLFVCSGCKAVEPLITNSSPVDLRGLCPDLLDTPLSSISLPSWLFECSAHEVHQAAACGHHVVIVGSALSPTFRVVEAVAISSTSATPTSVAAYVPLGGTLDVPVRPARRVGENGGVVELGAHQSVPSICHLHHPLYQREDSPAAGFRFAWSVPSSGGVYLWSYTQNGTSHAGPPWHSPSWRSGLDPVMLPGGVHRRVVRAVVVRDGMLDRPTPPISAVLEERGREVTWEERDIQLEAPGRGPHFTVEISPALASAEGGISGVSAALLGGLMASLIAGAVSFSCAGCTWTARSRLRRRNAAWEDLSRHLAAGALSPAEFGAAAARLAAEEDVLAAAPRLGHTPEHRRRLTQLVTTRQLTGEIDLTECNRRLSVLAAQHKVLAAEAANSGGWAAPGRWVAEAEKWLDEVALASDGPVARALDSAIQRGWFRSSQGEFVGAATATVVVVWGLYVMQR